MITVILKWLFDPNYSKMAIEVNDDKYDFLLLITNLF